MRGLIIMEEEVVAEKKEVRKAGRGGVELFIKVVEQHNAEHPEDCEKGRWVRNLPFSNDRYLYKDENGELFEYTLGRAFLSLNRGAFRVSEKQRAKIFDLVDIENGTKRQRKEGKLIEALEAFNKAHPKSCVNGRLVRDFPVKKDTFIWKDEDGIENSYLIGEGLRAAVYGQQKLSPSKAQRLDELIDMEKYREELRCRYHSPGRRSDLYLAVEQYILSHPDDCKDGKWVRNFPGVNFDFSWEDEEGNHKTIDLGAGLNRIATNRSNETFSEVISELVDMAAYQSEKESKRAINTAIYTAEKDAIFYATHGRESSANRTIYAADKLIYVLKQYIDTHPQDCINGVWIRNPPSNDTRFVFTNPQGQAEEYHLGKQLLGFRLGKMVATSKQYEEINNMMACWHNKAKNKSKADKRRETTVDKLVSAIVLYNRAHPDDCENGKLVKNFPPISYKIKIKNANGEIEDYPLGKNMYNVRFSKMGYREKTILFCVVDWDAYRNKRTSKDNSQSSTLAQSVVEEAVKTEANTKTETKKQD